MKTTFFLIALLMTITSCLCNRVRRIDTYLENQTDFPILIEFTFDPTFFMVDTLKITYSTDYKKPDSLLNVTNCCLRVYLSEAIRQPEINDAYGILCNSLFRTDWKTWDGLNNSIDTSEYNKMAKYCTTLDTLSNEKIQMNISLPPKDKFIIGSYGNTMSGFSELHIKWKSILNDSLFNRIDLMGGEAINMLTQKQNNYRAIIIK